jgi:hypothetical protein
MSILAAWIDGLLAQGEPRLGDPADVVCRAAFESTPSSYTSLPIATPARQAASPTSGLPNM